jgi:fructoselysine-6-P-deglycase FrlB-like protein
MEEMVVAERALPAPILAHPAAALVAAALDRALSAGDRVVVTGCGTSEHAARAIAALVDDAVGTPGAAIPIQAFDVALAPPGRGVVVAVTHEGETAATVAALAAARRAGATTCLITAAEESPAHAVADLVYPTPLRDRSWCHTVGYVSPLLAGAAVAAALARAPIAGDAVAAYLTACDEALTGVADLAERLAWRSRLIVVGSGLDAVTAVEAALKIEEGAWIPTGALQLETLLHGHLPAADDTAGLLAFLLDTRARAARAARTRQALVAAEAVGVETLLITTDRDAAASRAAVVLPASEPLGLLGALLAGAVAAQRTTLALAAQRGSNPDLLRRDDARYREAAALGGSPALAPPEG